MLRTFILQDESRARALYQFLKSNWPACAKAEKPLAVTVQEHGAKRSRPQNKRYWKALLGEIAANAWVDGRQFSEDAWHEFFKGKFIGLEETPDGRQVGISTTTLSVAEFSEYMTKIEAYAAEELGLAIPE